MNPTSPPAAPTALSSNVRLGLRSILVPVDFSPRSLKALQYATAFAHQFKAGITLVHVVQVYYYGGDLASAAVSYPEMETEMKETAGRQLAKLALESAPTDVLWRTLIRVGSPAVEIADVAKEINADLIIIGTHGHTGLSHVLLGSVAENVVRHAPCPVLTVREREHEFITVD